MRSITCTRRIQFCAGHRVLGHEGKCAHIHGHNYVALIEACADELDGIGRVIDFSVLKERIGGWIDAYWDHGFIVYQEDHEVLKFLTSLETVKQKTFVLPSNPTAENLAAFLLDAVCPSLMDGFHITICSVTIWETENCFAEACR